MTESLEVEFNNTQSDWFIWTMQI